MSVKDGEVKKYLRKAGLTATQIDSLRAHGYFDAPASKGHHLNCEGGLKEHSLNVTKQLVILTHILDVAWSRRESPYLVGMLHDLVKCRCYRLKDCESHGPVWEWAQPTYPGHGTCSVAIAAELGIRLNTDEIMAITYHMGQYGVGREYTDKEFDAALMVMAPNVLATIYADWWAARVVEEEQERRAK